MTEDNPHYITTLEAEKKYCPMTFSNSDTKAGHYRCVHHKCMAWRWAYKMSIEDDKLKSEYLKTHGYCGMVRN